MVNGENANMAFSDSIEIITKTITATVIKEVKEEVFDPFSLGTQTALDEIRKTVAETKESFREDVLDAIKVSRRELIENRIREFNVDELIVKFGELPPSIAAQNRKVKSTTQTQKMLKKQYETALVNLATIAGQSDFIGQNAEDRKAITTLLQDAVENIDKYEELVNINYQSTAKDKISLGVKDLNITTARNAYKKCVEIDNEVIEAQIVLDELYDTFSALKRIVNLISAVSV